MEKILNLFKIAFRNLKTRRLRSWLTIIGITIGVFLVIALLSLSQGIKEAVASQLKSLGDRILTVMPGDESNPLMGFIAGSKLEKEDIAVIKNVQGVEETVSFNYTLGTVRHKGEAKQILLNSMSLRSGLDVLREYQGFSLKSGNWPKPLRREVVIGAQLEKNIFKEEITAKDIISINGRKITVVGVLNSLGSKTDDMLIWMDEKLFQEITGMQTSTAQQLIVKIKDSEDPQKVAERIEEDLKEIRKRQRGSEEKGFMVLTSEKMGDLAGNILNTLQIAVVSFAGIAIIVGGIGIMNTMFTSVRERIKEIGIMKAVGAKDSTINLIFLFESGIIGLIGGVSGTLMGVIFARLIELYFQIHPIIYLKAYISPGIIIFGLFFSFLVGCFSGYFPAHSAAKLKPADALRRLE